MGIREPSVEMTQKSVQGVNLNFLMCLMSSHTQWRALSVADYKRVTHVTHMA